MKNQMEDLVSDLKERYRKGAHTSVLADGSHVLRWSRRSGESAEIRATLAYLLIRSAQKIGNYQYAFDLFQDPEIEGALELTGLREKICSDFAGDARLEFRARDAWRRLIFSPPAER